MKMRAIALPLVLLYPLYGGVMFAKQESILFPGTSSTHHAFAEPLPAQARWVELPASFGNARGVFWPARDITKPTTAVLYLHGNFETVENSFALIQPLLRAGIAVLQLEFPGYGGADGDPSYANVTQAADLAYDWLAQQPDVDAQRIVVMGYSIGGGAAGELTRRRNPAALILLSTYTSMEDNAHRYWLPAFLSRYPWDTRSRVADFSGPVFVAHGRRDNVIPFRMGERLAQIAQHAEFVALDCGHADCHFDTTLFATRIPTWLSQHNLLAPAPSNSQRKN